MIKVKNIKKSFKDIVLFSNANAEFQDGSKILIKGANGTGKSVFLKMIVGYSRPDDGEIIVDDYKVGKDEDFIQDAGVSINAPEFCNNWTGLENLLYLADIRKIATKEEILKLCKELEMDTVLNKKYKTYSLGMKQKLRIIQALIDKPKYLILDEPFDALDFKSQNKAIQLIDSYVTKDKLLVFTTHNSEHEKFADKVYEIENLQLKEVHKINHHS